MNNPRHFEWWEPEIKGLVLMQIFDRQSDLVSITAKYLKPIYKTNEA